MVKKLFKFEVVCLICMLLLLFCGCRDKKNSSDGENNVFEAKRVVMIGIDGMGSNESAEHSPNMHKLFENGATTHSLKAALPTISAQNWGSMFTAVSPDVHQMSNSSISGSRNRSGNFPTVFKQIRIARPHATLASFCSWGPINYGIVENEIGVHKYNDTASTVDDAEICQKALEYLDANDPTFMFVHFDGVDHAGHAYGYASPECFAAISVVDGYVQQIYNKIVQLGRADDTLFIVSVDHGGSGTGHGGDTDAEKYVFFGAIGKGVNNVTLEDIYVWDIPYVITTYLGVQPAETWAGKCPQDIFG